MADRNARGRAGEGAGCQGKDSLPPNPNPNPPPPPPRTRVTEMNVGLKYVIFTEIMFIPQTSWCNQNLRFTWAYTNAGWGPGQLGLPEVMITRVGPAVRGEVGKINYYTGK